MKNVVEIGGQPYTADFAAAIDISIPMEFDGQQASAYGVPIATAVPYKDGHFIGDTRQGGPCNFDTLTPVSYTHLTLPTSG